MIKPSDAFALVSGGIGTFRTPAVYSDTVYVVTRNGSLVGMSSVQWKALRKKERNVSRFVKRLLHTV